MPAEGKQRGEDGIVQVGLWGRTAGVHREGLCGVLPRERLDRLHHKLHGALT